MKGAEVNTPDQPSRLRLTWRRTYDGVANDYCAEIPERARVVIRVYLRADRSDPASQWYWTVGDGFSELAKGFAGGKIEACLAAEEAWFRIAH
jgi:hypothetical protein